MNVGPVEESDEFTLITTLGQGHHAILERGGENTEATLECEGILFTIDERDPGDGDEIVVDMKTTRISARKGIDEMGTYIDQIGSYCALQGLRRGRLHVFHLMGTYSPPFPIHRCYDLEFEPHELARWKDELLRRRDIVRGVDDLDDIPLAEHHTWVCKHCGLKDRHCPGGEGEWVGAFPRVVVE